jgi:hypothetical protein
LTPEQASKQSQQRKGDFRPHEGSILSLFLFLTSLFVKKFMGNSQFHIVSGLPLTVSVPIDQSFLLTLHFPQSLVTTFCSELLWDHLFEILYTSEIMPSLSIFGGMILKFEFRRLCSLGRCFTFEMCFNPHTYLSVAEISVKQK